MPSNKPAARKERPRAETVDENLQEYLMRELPSRKPDQVRYFNDALLTAAMRYDRYIARKSEWWKYGVRKNCIHTIANSMFDLLLNLSQLDIISRDDLESRVDPNELEKLVGSLLRFSQETTYLAKQVQVNGKPRNLAEERWILEIADIYESAFGRRAGVWSDPSTGKLQGNFYRLLQLSRPKSFRAFDKLNLRQINRVLRRSRREKS